VQVESAVSVVAENDLKTPKPVEKLHGSDWGEHQVITSHNYGVDSGFWLQTSGGLNLQVWRTVKHFDVVLRRMGADAAVTITVCERCHE
jgi:hypothetical protein